MVLEAARNLVQTDLVATDKFIIGQLQSEIPLINQMVEYILKCGGKRIRPLILLLSAKAFSDNGDKPVHLAAVIELIHTATLLHDDVVDNSTLRRGHKTANAVWGNEASVLVGDFLYSRAFQIVVNLRRQPVLDIFAQATHYMAEGEILQLVHAHNPDTTEATYFEVIQRKTAKLFEVAAELGVALLDRDEQDLKAMRHYGLDLGLAYQLIDDVLDYSPSSAQTGKNIGNDLAEGKMTLLMIHALRKGSAAEVALLREAITAGKTERVDSVIEIIESTGAIEYTAQLAKQYAHKACSALTQIPGSPYRQALHDLAEFVVQRSY
jgi:octaprenyl-diphosphate synthase